MLYLSFFFSNDHSLLIIMISAVLHELGHLGCALIRGVSVTEIKINAIGARIALGGIYSYTDEMIISVFGPLVNIITGFIALSLTHLFGHISELYLFFASSVTLAIINLLPIRTLDGGRILSTFLLKKLEISVSNTILSVSSFVVLFSIWTVSVYLLLKLQSISMFMFAISIFFDIISKEE